MINTARVELLVRALESGEYRKGTGLLHKITDKGEEWCCLGVACDIAARGGCQVIREMFNGAECFGGERQVLPPSVMRWFGFEESKPQLLREDGIPVTATMWNDHGPDGKNAPEDDFTRIAAAFRRTFLEDRDA